ncbi:ABC transporter permease [Paenibacillus protaetiae]|uniref:ABC transporter permease n=1 Tax=Paenibacillus protaetiae TaxID=2509456 RepID=A0A4P6ER12_9BACL|nr:ABC transporter permease [Paenibacillus protaetiae]QAY65294.1 ABC transporter permease [Paenibacillus protaetiae]
MWNELSFLVGSTLRMTFRKKINLLLFFGLPLAGVLLSLLLYGSGTPAEMRIGVVNGDGSEKIASDTVAFLKSLQNVKLVDVTEPELKQQLFDGKLDSGLILQPGFSASVLSGSPDHIAVESVKGASATSYMKSMLASYINNVSGMVQLSGGDSGKFERLYDSYRQNSFAVTAQSVNDASSKKEMSYQSVGFLILFMMMSAVGLSELILKNRENRTYFRVLSSPVSAKVYVLSNIIVNVIVMLAQIVVVLVCMRYVFNLDPGVPMGILALLLGIFALVSVSISLVIVSFSKNSAAAGAIQNLVITPTCLISGCFFSVSIMPDYVQRIADFLPQRWVLQSIEQLQSGASLSGIGMNFVILLAFAAVFFLLAVYKFGRNNDTRNFV